MTSPFFNVGTTVPPNISTQNQNPFGLNPFVSLSPSVYVSPVKRSRKRRGSDAILSVNSDYSEPMVSVHEDFHNDVDLQYDLSEAFYYKILDKWLYNEFSDLLEYFSRNKKSKRSEIIRKIEKSKILTKKKIRKMIAEYVDDKDINWTDLYEKQDSLKRFLKKKLQKLFKKANY
jgi:hypothetical protein